MHRVMLKIHYNEDRRATGREDLTVPSMLRR